MSSSTRLLIIGLDGATWRVIMPLVQQGLLPNIARLQQQGVWSDLLSTTPPATYPAWTTFMTGRNPGKHGIFDFTRRVPGSCRIGFVNATFCRSRTLWQRLSDAGLRVGVMGLPATYPPQQVNGFMISGFDSPVARGIDPSFVKPPGLYPYLKRRRYKISELLETHMDEGWHAAAVQKIVRGISVKAQTALELYRREPWDCFMALFGETDTVAHHFWKYHDSTSPRHEGGAAPLCEAVSAVYRRLDDVVGTFAAALHEDSALLLVSDHGFGGIGTRALSINRWLMQQGLLCADPKPSAGSRALGAVKQLGLRFMPHGLQQRVFRSRLSGLAARMETAARFGGIDWARTSAFSEDLNHAPSIYLNLQGPDQQGAVAAADYERMRAQIIARLHDLRDPLDGRRLVRRAWRREELYAGPEVAHAPDIVIEFAVCDGHSCLVLPRHYFPEGAWFREFAPAELSGPRLLSMSGSHRPEGIFLAAGAGVKPAGRLARPPHIADLYPSILSRFGLSVEADVDGRPVSGFAAEQPSRTAGAAPDIAAASPYTTGEERILTERLRNLGYLD